MSGLEHIGEDGMVETFSGVCISKEASELFDDIELSHLLRGRGVDLTRQTRIRGGCVYYIRPLSMASN